MKTYIYLLAVTIVVSAACDDTTRLTIPTSPVPTPSSPTVYTLSGMVTEMTPSGPAPLEGAVVQFVGFPFTTTTDGAGSYTLSLSTERSSPVLGASKPGYTSTYTSVVPGDARRDFQLSRIVTYTLSGQVFEVTATGRLPIEGVQVYCDGCGSPVGHTFERTDANGQYRFEWTPNGAMPLWVDKAGYALAGNQPVGSMPGLIVPTVNGDTRFDIELVRQ